MWQRYDYTDFFSCRNHLFFRDHIALFEALMKNNTSPHFSEDIIPLDVYRSELGVLYFYENLVVGEFNEGTNISFQNGFSLLLKALKYIGTRPIVYISNRVNSYSVQPNDYKYLEKVPNIKAIAIVCHDPMGTSSAALESKFYSKTFGVFRSIREAKNWSDSILETYLTKSK